MSGLSGRIKVLTENEILKIHKTALEILNNPGIKIFHDDARSILGNYGCKVDNGSMMVSFPPELVENTVRKMRKDYLSPSRKGLKQAVRYTEVNYYKRDEELRHDFTCNGGGFCTLIYDIDKIRRPAVMKDFYDGLKLVNYLDDITYSGPPVSDQNTPHYLRPIKMAAELAKYTKKPGGIEAWTKDDIRFIREIAVVVKGSLENLLKEPCLVGYGETRSPLALDSNMADLFIEYIRQGFPQSIDTMPCAGTTAPATTAGTLALGLAETLCGLVLGYAVDENAILSIDFTGGFSDMKSLIFSCFGPDRQAMICGWIQILKDFYGISSGVHAGKTNACEPGFQAGMEKAQSILFPLLCGASGIGTVGQVENLMTFSPVQLVLDAEIVRGIRRTMRGFEVSDDTLCLDVIRRIGPEGNFISDPHTLEHFRDEFWLSDLTECINCEGYSRKKNRGMEYHAEEKAREIMKMPLEPALDDNQIKEIDKIVANAEKYLAK